MSRRRKPQSRNPAARPEDRGPRGGSTPTVGGAQAVAQGDDDAPGTASAADSISKVAAVGLWAVVGAGLVYGVSQTLVKVVALFGG